MPRFDPLGTGVPGASSGPPPRSPGVGTRAVASLYSGICAVLGGHCLSDSPDVSVVHEHAEAAVALSTEQGFPLWAALGTSMRGWALAYWGQGEAGMAQVRQGVAAWRATSATMLVPYLCTVLVEVADHLGHLEDGLQRWPVYPGGAA